MRLTYGEAEEARPQLGAPVGEEGGVRLEHGSNEVPMAVLVLAPVLELGEDGVFLPEGAPQEQSTFRLVACSGALVALHKQR